MEGGKERRQKEWFVKEVRRSYWFQSKDTRLKES